LGLIVGLLKCGGAKFIYDLLARLFMNQELMWKASMVERQARELEGNLDILNQELMGLSNFDNSLGVLSVSDEKGILSPVGQGVFMKSEIVDKKLFVDVGAGVFVRKSAEETQGIVREQIGKLTMARDEMNNKLNGLHEELQRMIGKMEKEGGI